MINIVSGKAYLTKHNKIRYITHLDPSPDNFLVGGGVKIYFEQYQAGLVVLRPTSYIGLNRDKSFKGYFYEEDFKEDLIQHIHVVHVGHSILMVSYTKLHLEER